ncbi:MAG: hypothetical protein MUO52_02525 [Desulfobacterales bacterium]|nr:hypothetical protein [Desulfobacterales bacterium]
MPVGNITKEEHYRELPVFEKKDRNYVPRQEMVRKISAIDEKIDKVMFLGTWRKDSVREAPTRSEAWQEGHR